MSKTRNRRTESFRGVAPFSLRSSHAADMRTIAVCGELDLATAPALERELQDAQAAGARVIVLDLGGVEFIDSTGLRVIITAHRRAGAQLLILNCSKRMQRPFELCGLIERLTFVNEIPAHNAATTGISGVTGVTGARSSVTRRTATVRRSTRPRSPVADESCARGRLRPGR
jgi:anti-sigma B factor antagonist